MSLHPTPLIIAFQILLVSLSCFQNSPKLAQTQPKVGLAFSGFSLFCLSCIIQASWILKDAVLKEQRQKGHHWLWVACWWLKWDNGEKLGKQENRGYENSLNFFPCHSYFLALTFLLLKWLVLVNIQWVTRETWCFINELLFEVLELKMKSEVVLDTLPFQISQNTNITRRILFFFLPSFSPIFKRNIFGWNLVMKN